MKFFFVYASVVSYVALVFVLICSLSLLLFVPWEGVVLPDYGISWVSSHIYIIYFFYDTILPTCHCTSITVNPLHTDIRYNDKIRYNDNSNVMKSSLKS